MLARQSSRPDSLLERGDIIAGLALVLGVLVSLIFETKDFEFASSRTVLEQQPVK